MKRDAENGTPLLAASYHGRTDAVRLLLSAGADVNRAESRYGFTPLINAAWKGHADIVDLLLDSGDDISARTVDGKTALDKAREEQHSEIVKRLCGAAGTLTGDTGC